MFDLRIDRERNALFVSIKGSFTTEEAARATHQFKQKLKELDKGFSVVNDISHFESVEEGALILLLEALEVLDAGKPARIIRVEGEGGLSNGKVFFDKALGKAYIGYRVTKVKSMQEALDILDSH